MVNGEKRGLGGWAVVVKKVHVESLRKIFFKVFKMYHNDII